MKLFGKLIFALVIICIIAFSILIMHKRNEKTFALINEVVLTSFELGAMYGYEAGVVGETYGCEDTECIGEIIRARYEIEKLVEGRE